MDDGQACEPSLGHDPPAEHGAGVRHHLSRVSKKIFTWYVLKTVVLGQMLSLFICGTAVTSQFLAEQYKVDAPMLQSFINYCLLFLVYTVWLAFRSGENGLLHILRNKWWKYILLAIVDVEANYSIVKAYQFTTITSVQLLDCVGIPVLMVLSWFILRSRYKLIHYIAVVVCLLGVGTMVGADVLSGREEGKASDMLIGDALVILGACLYAVSNVTEEYVVKNLTREEFLGMLGLFGTLISGIQMMIVEYSAIGSIKWDWKVIEDVMRRWRSIRDQYRSEHQQRARSGSVAPTKRKYVYFDRLSFLAPIMDLRPKVYQKHHMTQMLYRA